jgi:hypothetical protein
MNLSLTGRRFQSHPVDRREPLPWRFPKTSEEDPHAAAQVRAILESPSYRRALLLGYNIDRAQIMSGLCRSFYPTRIDTHSVGRISKPCRPLYGAEDEMTHDADRNYREAGSKKYLHASSSGLL